MSQLDNSAWHVRIPARLRQAVERIAEREYMHPSQVVRKLLDRALQQHEAGEKQVSV